MGSHIDKTTKYDTLDKYVKQRYKKVLRDQVRYDKYKKNMKIKDEEFTAEMKFIEEKLLFKDNKYLEMPDIPEVKGSFLYPYYFPMEKKHAWIRENMGGYDNNYRYASFDKVEKFIFPGETGS